VSAPTTVEQQDTRSTAARVPWVAVMVLASGCKFQQRMHLKKGNELYTAQKYEQAIEEYKKLVEAAEGFSGSQTCLHRCPLLGEPCLLPRFRSQRIELCKRMREIVAIPLGGNELGPRLNEFAFNPRHMGPSLCDARNLKASE